MVVESFVDTQLFRGTAYQANGWEAPGPTQGFARNAQDFYVAHQRPKQIWVRELAPGTRAKLCLATDQLPPAWAAVSARIAPRCTQTCPASSNAGKAKTKPPLAPRSCIEPGFSWSAEFHSAPAGWLEPRSCIEPGLEKETHSVFQLTYRPPGIIPINHPHSAHRFRNSSCTSAALTVFPASMSSSPRRMDCSVSSSSIDPSNRS